jgi:hypothetical protein
MRTIMLVVGFVSAAVLGVVFDHTRAATLHGAPQVLLGPQPSAFAAPTSRFSMSDELVIPEGRTNGYQVEILKDKKTDKCWLFYVGSTSGVPAFGPEVDCE